MHGPRRPLSLPLSETAKETTTKTMTATKTCSFPKNKYVHTRGIATRIHIIPSRSARVLVTEFSSDSSTHVVFDSVKLSSKTSDAEINVNFPVKKTPPVVIFLWHLHREHNFEDNFPRFNGVSDVLPHFSYNHQFADEDLSKDMFSHPVFLHCYLPCVD